MEQVTKYIEQGRTFYIFEEKRDIPQRGYWAFEDCFFDEAGRLTKEFNGITGFHSDNIATTIERVSLQINVDRLVNDGMDCLEACMMAMCKQRRC